MVNSNFELLSPKVEESIQILTDLKSNCFLSEMVEKSLLAIESNDLDILCDIANDANKVSGKIFNLIVKIY